MSSEGPTAPSAPDRAFVALVDGTVDLVRRVVHRPAGDVRLTAMEARLVSFLARHPGVPFDKERLHAEVWGYRPGVQSRTAISTIQRLRKKLEIDAAAPRHLVTEPAGYVWHGPSPSAIDDDGPRRPRDRDANTRPPVPATPFIGRAREVAALRALLARDDTRVVTLVGPGGMGKTRLALEVARPEVIAPRAVRFVACASVTALDEVVAALAGTLGVASAGSIDLALVDALERTPTLVVLDNLEHLAGAGALVQRLVERVPSLRVLGTSRAPLGLSSEHVHRVDGLLAPTTDRDEDALASDAGALLLDVARRVAPGFSPDDRGSLGRIVRLVEGMPLAIVLAASWLRVLKPTEIAAEIARGVDVLSAELADLDPRHRSVDATLRGTLALLDDDQRRQVAALATLRAPFDADAARAVSDAALTDLARLVDVSLLRRTERGRFDFHPLLGELLRRELARDAELLSQARERRYHLFRGRAADVSERLMRGRRADLERTRDDLPDILEVWREAVERDDIELVWTLFVVLFALWESQFAPMAELLHTTLAVHGPALSQHGPRGRALLAAMKARAALVLPSVGRLVEAERAFADAGQLLDDEATRAFPEAAAFASLEISRRLLFAGQHVHGRALAQRVVELDDAGRLAWWSSIAEGLGAAHAARLGDLSVARAAASRLDEDARSPGLPHGEGRHRATLALAFWFGGEPTTASGLASDALSLLSDDPDRGFFALAIGILAHALIDDGDRDEARQAVREALEEQLAHDVPPLLGALGVLAAARLLDDGEGPRALAGDVGRCLRGELFPPLVRDLVERALPPGAAASSVPPRDPLAAYRELVERLALAFDAA